MLHAAAVGSVAVALSLAGLPDACAAAATKAVGAPVRGLDVSAYQHAGRTINWAKIANQGISFVGIKASEGTYYLNPYYQSDARAAAAAGLRVMPYAFANPNRGGGTATANFAVNAVGGSRAAAALPIVVDLENDPYKKKADCYGLGAPAMISWIAGFTARAEALTGKWPVIYTTSDWWRECTGSTSQFKHDPLWLAAFGGTRPTVPSPWSHWTFWQYDNAGSLPGIGQTDLDYYQPTDGLPALKPLARPEPAKKHHPKKAHAKGPAATGSAKKGPGKAAAAAKDPAKAASAKKGPAKRDPDGKRAAATKAGRHEVRKSQPKKPAKADPHAKPKKRGHHAPAARW
jgi:lysozyme